MSDATQKGDVHADIGARMAAEKALRERAHALQAIVDNSPSVLSLKHPDLRDLRYALANPKLQEIHKLAEKDIIGKTDFDLYPEGVARAFRANDELLVKSGTPLSVEELVPVNGELRNYMSHMFPIHDADGNMQYICRISLDITDRKRTEAELKAQHQRFAGIVESAMDAVITIDGSQRIVMFNAAAEAMFRCTTGEVIGDRVERFMPARFRAAHAGHIARFGTTGSTSRGMGRLGEVYGVRANGEEFPIEASISQIELTGEKLYTVILRDISARVAAEEQIRRMNAELEARVEARTAELQDAYRELESFTYAVSHDLRSPLRSMTGFAQALVEDYGDQLDGTAREYLGHIEDASRAMGALIDGLLQLSRNTRGELQCERLDLSALAEEIRAGLERQEPARRVEWRIEEGLEAVGDRLTLEAMLRNLLENAWKYSAGTDHATISFAAEHDGQRRWFCVADNGAGFDMEHAARLFQPFQRLHREDEFPGIGIGLATVQRIVRRHGGEIRAHGEPGCGARFCFTLPQQERRAS